jgi:glycosyltransferase involved in cell wall biosynthesis
VKLPKKVLFIGYNASRSGAPLLLLHFMKWLRQNSTIEFELLLKSGGELLQEFSKVCPTRCLNELAPKPPKSRAARLALSIAQRLGFFQPQAFDLKSFYPPVEYPIVYANTVATFDLALQLVSPDRRIINHVHELSYSVECHGGIEALKNTIPITFVYIAASHAVREYLENDVNVPSDRIRVIHEFPVANYKNNRQSETRQHLRGRLGIGEDVFIIGMCGSVEWRKGTDLFVQLARDVKRSFRSVKCHFVWIGGSSNDHRESLHDIAKLGLQDICHFIPAVANPEIYFNAFDLFALTSREDPFSVAMLEAAASGLPIVCFAGSGGAAELVEDDAGIIVPYLDVSAMAKACIELLTDEERRRQLGENARAKVQERYALDFQGRKILAVLKSALDEPLAHMEQCIIS